MKYFCSNCDYHTEDIEDLDLIDDMMDRVCVGEIHPAGQCPVCASLIPAPDEDVAACVGLEGIAALMRSLGWIVEEPK